MANKVGFIPLRKGSKGIPGKNKKKLVGRPLFCWSLGEAIKSDLDLIYVFTDDIEIIDFIVKEYKWCNKVKTLVRDDANAVDTSSTESAMLEFVNKINFDFELLCLLQATSPLISYLDINNSIHKVINEGFDSSISVVKTHRFIWDKDGNALNYDVFKRPRRQDFDGLLIENGAVYMTSKNAFANSNNRISGKIGVVEMKEESLMEIDSLSDWNIIENILINELKSQKENKRINYLVLDVDGVFTDGCVYFGSEGELAKKFDMRDGMGLEILRQNGVEVVVMTSEDSELVAKRMQKLKISNAYLGVKDKYSFLNEFIKEKNTNFAHFAYVGDDVNDLANMCRVGWSFAPKNATKDILYHADVVLNNNSAEGAIREVTDFLMTYNKRFK